MSREHESPNDPMHEPNLERLVEVERQLKKARPRPIELDAIALERAARPATLPKKFEQSTSRRRRYRSVVAVAGSWACGAVVGAIVMFLLMSQTVPGGDSETRRADVEQGIAEPVPTFASAEGTEETTAPTERRDRIGLDAAVLALSSSSPADGYSAYRQDGSAFRAGMHLSRFASEQLATTYAAPMDDEDVPLEIIEDGPSDPARTITREQLLRDLLADPSGFVL